MRFIHEVESERVQGCASMLGSLCELVIVIDDNEAIELEGTTAALRAVFTKGLELLDSLCE